MNPSSRSLSHQLGFVLGTFAGICLTVWHASNSRRSNPKDLKKHLHQFTDQLPEAVDDLVDLLYQRKSPPQDI